jgi:signal transduction histidine kinase
LGIIYLVPALLLIERHYAAAPWLALIKCWAIFAAAGSYYFGVRYLESRLFVDGKLAQWQCRGDWSDVLRVIAPAEYRCRKEEGQERLALASLLVLTLFLLWLVVGSGNGAGALSPWWLATQAAVVMLVAALAAYRLAFLYRKFSLEALEPFVAERQRYQSLGEIAGLVIHDLSSPLHVIQLCVEQWNDKPSVIEQERFRQRLAVATQRALDLVGSLRAYLASPATPEAGSLFSEAQEEVLRFLEAQFHAKGFARLRVTVDPALGKVKIRMRKPALVHVLFNVLANSVENLLSHSIDEGVISLELQQTVGGFAQLLIRDNGTGISINYFEYLTGTGDPRSFRPREPQSLGLKLVRRLVESHGGTLKLGEVANGEPGTALLLKLPLAQ